MDQKIIGKWNEIRGEILKTWGEIRGSELDKAKGNLVAIAGLLQQKAGVARGEAEKRLNELVAKATAKVGPKGAEKLEEVKTKAQGVARKANEKLEAVKGKLKDPEFQAKVKGNVSEKLAAAKGRIKKVAKKAAKKA
jgi:uncharacterized protein YjbJ (UPF0337 family)